MSRGGDERRPNFVAASYAYWAYSTMSVTRRVFRARSGSSREGGGEKKARLRNLTPLGNSFYRMPPELRTPALTRRDAASPPKGEST